MRPFTGFAKVLLKAGTLLAFCGGPLLFAEALRPHLGPQRSFLVAFSPFAVVLFATLVLEEDPGPLSRFVVRLGLVATVLGLGVQFWGVAWLLRHPTSPARGLHWTGIAVGLLGGAAFFRAALAWLGAAAQPVPAPGGFVPLRPFHPPARPILCAPSRLRLLGLLGLAGALVGVSFFCTTLPGFAPRLVGWIGVAFFGLGLVALPLQALRGGPSVVLDGVGVEDRRLGIGRIEWNEIEALSVVEIHGTRLLALHLADPEAVLARLSPWKRRAARMNEALGFQPITLGFVGLDPGLDEVLRNLGMEG